MDKKERDQGTDPGQRKWDEAGPDKATGRTSGVGGPRYNEGEAAAADTPETTHGNMAGGPLGAREGRPHDGQGGMADSLGGPGAGTNNPATAHEQRFGGAHTAGTRLRSGEESEWKGGTPEQGPTTGGMGSAGGGHDTDETDVWGDKDKRKDP
jgi:hypothetical protein